MSAGTAVDRSARNADASLNGHVQAASAPAENVAGRASVDHGVPSAPEVHLNGRPASSMGRQSRSGSVSGDAVPGEGWGANFWVTLIDPQTQVSFYACPATGEVSWDPPVGNFLLPPNPEGEWWEMIDEASGLPYYYHTKSSETVWERPNAFVIPLGILQNTALGRRLSARRSSPKDSAPDGSTHDRVPYRRSNSYRSDQDLRQSHAANQQDRRSQSASRRSPSKTSPTASPAVSPGPSKKTPPRRPATSSDHVRSGTTSSGGPLAYPRGHPLAPIPGSPYVSDASSAVPSRKSMSAQSITDRYAKAQDAARNEQKREEEEAHQSQHDGSTLGRSRSKSSSYLSYRAPQPQSLSAALEMIALSDSRSTTSSLSADKIRTVSENGHGERSATPSLLDPRKLRISTDHGDGLHTAPASPNPMWQRGKKKEKAGVPPSPRRPMPALPHAGGARSVSTPTPATIDGKVISTPIFNPDATRDMNQAVNAGTVPAELYRKPTHASAVSLNTGKYLVLPHELSSDIQQFAESHFARQYFSTHRVGFLFKRKVPVEQMMSWQKAPLSSPLLQLNRSLHKNALKIFKVIQHIMGDRERERAMRFGGEGTVSSAMANASTTSLPNPGQAAKLEDERWLLSEGIAHGELRDEIYCQVMKQLTGNPSAESVFKGWQLLCVLLVTFPPSKDFETYLRSYFQQATVRHEGRVDVMAKYCLRRLAYIARKGPRGKPPTTAEIETASDAAFHPSIFGESLDTVFRLQERSYPHMKVPIILPFLADGILALGGTKTEGIFRIPGDGDSVSELKLRIEKGYYSLDAIDDPHILASLMKLWLRELCDPLVPDELYHECIRASKSPEACVSIVQRLPTINRRVVLFVISFLQLFLDEKVSSVTKMTSPNLALVMAPNLLRCNSESIAVVFTNAQYEHTFVHNLLLHLRCDTIDPDYIPTHGQGAVSPTSPPPKNSQGRRRPNH
ncbi:uncharacterized protein C8Q71DRAFT_716454 [Rhodofomes roseus]|uniref:Rho GTPase-activating protein 39 n=1 Tax=Rhodofomes roseus TaxID=34475 RepID=A0ABQ8K1Z4_9APHY|nr:uncharacterized protein C8Q71DRAFT_716454 [Rhodofomes roseus]KAH9830765.1 hypothetical protein C8Q71DRAFT_716454 [Rhodofomes roseus]